MGTSRNLFAAVAVTAIAAAGCTAATRRGVVVMKVDDTEAHVGLGANEVTPSDQLTVFRYICTTSKTARCEKRKIGSGQVTQVLNESYSVARFRSSINLREGDIVERAAAPQ
jgi:hypothetical protein